MSVFSQITNTQQLVFEVELGFSSSQSLCRATYRVQLGLTAKKELEVEQESLRLDDRTHGQGCGFTLVNGQTSWDGQESFWEGRYSQMASPHDPTSKQESSRPSFFRQHRPDRLLLEVIGGQPFIDLADGIRSIGCFNFHPASMRQPQRNFGSPALERDGRNLARAIEVMKEMDPESLARVHDYLAAIVPGIEGFAPKPLGDYETVSFRLHSPLATRPLELSASSMSDGTLRVLAALIGAYQMGLPYGYRSVVGIEEPETSLHPAAMRALVDALDEATGRTQILLTTHSADLLDDRDLTPAQVLVVRNIAGQTQIAPVDPASREIIRKELYTLADLHRQDHLEPDAADLQRQAELARMNGKE